MAIKLRIGTNTRRTEVTVLPSEKLDEVLEANDISTRNGIIHLKGSVIPGCDLSKSFEELDIADGEEASLIVSIKQDSGR